MTANPYKRMLPVIAALAALLTLASGCRSTAFYQDRAVERARTYLLENASELTPIETAYIRYNKPVLLSEAVLGEKAGWEASSGMNQICVTWLLPEREDAYLVFGVSDVRMVDWKPKQLIRKKFTPPDKNRLAMIGMARAYTINNLFAELGEHATNHVRFADPEIIRTNFTVTHDHDRKLPEDALRNKVQYSLVWRIQGESRVIIVCGSGNANLSGFQILFGGFVEPLELEQHTVRPEPASPPPAPAAGPADAAKKGK